MQEYKVSEIFYSIEGEGIKSGELAVFLRLFGCNLHCSYCDTRYACDEGEPFSVMSIADIKQSIARFASKNLTITGGEPLICPNIDALIKELASSGYKINIETNGSVDIDIVLRQRDMIFTCDYKCKGSCMSEKMFVQNLNKLQENDVLKFVVLDIHDLQQAKQLIEEYKPKCYIYFSPVYGKIEPYQIVDFLKQNSLVHKTRVQLQLHKYIYPPTKRGV